MGIYTPDELLAENMRLRDMLKRIDHTLSHFACLQMGDGNLLMIKQDRDAIKAVLK